MPSKKSKGSQKDEEPLKPLSHYVKDRLELTTQLFSCLKKKQIKSRLPANLQKKSMERIQQICLDEILGISTKRLLSIINNTHCPENTESSDSEIEHISLSEISSDSEIEESSNEKESPKHGKKKTEEEPLKEKSEKEMTMLELLELQARARAIRSQLALEPVTKIELDSDGENEVDASATNSTNKVNTSKKDQQKSKTPEKIKFSKNDKKEDKLKEPNPSSSRKLPEVNNKRVVKEKTPESIQISSLEESIPTNKPKAAPIKLKRNFKGTEMEGYPLSIIPPPLKEKTPPKDEGGSSSPDVITMEQNIATYFISDSEDEEEPPPKKKSPSPKIIVQSIEILPTLNMNNMASTTDSNADQNLEEGELKDQEDLGSVTANENENSKNSENSSKVNEATENRQGTEVPGDSTQDEDDDNIVNIMSDTEIDLNANSDKEDEELNKKPQKQETKPHEKEQATEKNENKFSQSDSDVVEIHTSDDDLDSAKPSESAKNSDESETWEQRYLKSSNVKNVLKTAKLATKVRGKIVQNKRSLIAANKQKEKEEREKDANEETSQLEEGSLEQFHGLKESSSSSQ